MNKYIKIKNIVIVILCFTVVVMAAGFVVLSINLENIKNEKSSFEVVFKKAKKTSSLKGGTIDPKANVKIMSSGTVAKMDLTLYAVHDEITYDLNVQNKGTSKAIITDLIVSPDFSDKDVIKEIEPISVDVSNIGGKILEPGEEATVKVNVFYNTTQDEKLLGTHNIKAKIGIIAKSISDEE